MSTQDPMQVLYHLSKTIESQAKAIQQMQTDIHSIQTSIEIMKATGQIPDPNARKQRMKDTSIGSGIGGIFVAIIIGVWEYFKKG